MFKHVLFESCFRKRVLFVFFLLGSTKLVEKGTRRGARPGHCELIQRLHCLRLSHEPVCLEVASRPRVTWKRCVDGRQARRNAWCRIGSTPSCILGALFASCRNAAWRAAHSEWRRSPSWKAQTGTAKSRKRSRSSAFVVVCYPLYPLLSITALL